MVRAELGLKQQEVVGEAVVTNYHPVQNEFSRRVYCSVFIHTALLVTPYTRLAKLPFRPQANMQFSFKTPQGWFFFYFFLLSSFFFFLKICSRSNTESQIDSMTEACCYKNSCKATHIKVSNMSQGCTSSCWKSWWHWSWFPPYMIARCQTNKHSLSQVRGQLEQGLFQVWAPERRFSQCPP